MNKKLLLLGLLSSTICLADMPAGAFLAPLYPIVRIFLAIGLIFFATPIVALSGFMLARFFLKNSSYSVDRMVFVQIGLAFFAYYLFFKLLQNNIIDWHNWGKALAVSLLAHLFFCWLFFYKLRARDIVLIALLSLLALYLALGIFWEVLVLRIWLS